jgi:hypothetical protein
MCRVVAKPSLRVVVWACWCVYAVAVDGSAADLVVN